MRPAPLAEGAAPFFYPGSEVGCLVLHGFTGSPQEVRWLGHRLNRAGYTVIGPRLAGHGARPEDMQGIRWQEWYADTLAAYHQLRQHCRAVFAVGLSMGGVLSLMLAANEELSGVVGLSTPFMIDRRWRRPFLRLAGLMGLMMPKDNSALSDRIDRIVRAEQKARGEPVIGRLAYPTYTAWAADQLWSLLEANVASLPRVTAPALLVQSESDETVPLGHVDRIFAALGSADKRRLIVHESRHVITEDVDREVVFDAVAEFIGEKSRP